MISTRKEHARLKKQQKHIYFFQNHFGLILQCAVYLGFDAKFRNGWKITTHKKTYYVPMEIAIKTSSHKLHAFRK